MKPEKLADCSSATKAEIRALTLKRRNELPQIPRQEYSQSILNRVLAIREFREAKIVMAYSGFGSEIDTLPLLRSMLERGQTLVLPKVNRPAGTLDLYQVKNLDTELSPGVFGIGEPSPRVCPPAIARDIEAILVPGLAFDRQGGRVGYGKGYYDRFLTACHDKSHYPFTIAAAFELQVWDAIPMEAHDVRMDTLVTEAGAWSTGWNHVPTSI